MVTESVPWAITESPFAALTNDKITSNASLFLEQMASGIGMLDDDQLKKIVEDFISTGELPSNMEEIFSARCSRAPGRSRPTTPSSCGPTGWSTSTRGRSSSPASWWWSASTSATCRPSGCPTTPR